MVFHRVYIGVFNLKSEANWIVALSKKKKCRKTFMEKMRLFKMADLRVVLQTLARAKSFFLGLVCFAHYLEQGQ